MDNLYVLTGAPGTGKTALVNALRTVVETVAEPARRVLAEHRRGPQGHHDLPHDEFVRRLLDRSIADHRAHLENDRSPVLFDRGIPDCIAYATYLGVDPEPSLRAAQQHAYQPTALVLAPWPDIYVPDEERRMDLAAVETFDGHVRRAWRRAGYDLRDVPRGSVDERANDVYRWIQHEQGIEGPVRAVH